MSRRSRFLKRLLARPLLWALVYLACIPTFAVAYDQPGYFTDAALAKERPYSVEVAASIESVLERAYARNLTPASIRGQAMLPNGTLVEPMPSVGTGFTNVRVDGRMITFELALMMRGEHPHQYALEGQLAWAAHEHPLYGLKRFAYVRNLRPVPLFGEADPSWPMPLSDVFPGPAAFNGVPVLHLTTSEAARVERFGLAAGTGDPYFARGNLLRMLYFSATTITTLGLGDLVPITAASRAVVAAEALAGIVLAGLFLASLAKAIIDSRD